MKERFMNAGAACALVGAMTALNDEVRRFVTGALGGDGLPQLASVGGPTRRVIGAMADPLGAYASDHVVLLFFGLATIAVLGLMLRT